MGITKDWKVIVQHSDLDDMVDIGKVIAPKVISSEMFEFTNKEEAFEKFAELIHTYDEKSYDSKGHSFGALKFYRESEGKDILTYILLHLKGEEYGDATDDDEELINRFLKY